MHKYGLLSQCVGLHITGNTAMDRSVFTVSHCSVVIVNLFMRSNVHLNHIWDREDIDRMKVKMIRA